MVHTKNNFFSMGFCAQEHESHIENAYLFGYLSAIEAQVEKLEDRTGTLESVLGDRMDFYHDEESEDEDEDEEENEMLSNPCCTCCGFA